jgi:hypothetical protein
MSSPVYVPFTRSLSAREASYTITWAICLCILKHSARTFSGRTLLVDGVTGEHRDITSVLTQYAQEGNQRKWLRLVTHVAGVWKTLLVSSLHNYQCTRGMGQT